MWKVECGKWDVQNRKWNVENGMNVGSGMWKLQCGTWNVESGMWKVDSGKWNMESGMWHVERKRRNAESGTWKETYMKCERSTTVGAVSASLQNSRNIIRNTLCSIIQIAKIQKMYNFVTTSIEPNLVP